MTPVKTPPQARSRCRVKRAELATSRRCNLYAPRQMDEISVKCLETGVVTQREFLDFAYSGFVYQRAYFKLIDELASTRGQASAVTLGAQVFAEVQVEIDCLLQKRAASRIGSSTISPE